MKSKILGGMLLVTGTTVGAGMLALPVLTGLGGFFPAIPLFFLCWIATAYSAFLILEVNLWFEEETNLISMARQLLGRTGAAFTWLCYLLLLYSLTAAYIAGGGPLLAKGIDALLHITLPPWTYPFPFVIIFGLFISFGTRSVDLINRLFMLGLIVSYAALLFWIAPHVKPELLRRHEFHYAWLALPVIVASFGFQMIIPNLTHYLHRNIKALRLVIWLGTGVPFLIYLLWEGASLGIIPLKGKESLVSAFIEGKPATVPLSAIENNIFISTSANFFAFFAVVTSFLGASLSLASFLNDGLSLKSTLSGKLKAIACTFVPPLAFVLVYPRGFITALEYAGIFFSVLLQILPVIMVWHGRYNKRISASYKVFGGKPLLLLLLAYSLVVIGIKLLPSQSLSKIALIIAQT